MTTMALSAPPSSDNALSSPNINSPTESKLHEKMEVDTDDLLLELQQRKELARRLDEELYYLKHTNNELTEKERQCQERMNSRKKDQQQLLDNYNQHIKSRRATDDDPNTILTKLQELKRMIKELSVSLGQHCEPAVATKAISSFWVNLNQAILNLGDPLPIPRIIMLTEKFLMDVLVQSMHYNLFTGLSISQSYTQLQMWFERYERNFCTRLRQEVAMTVVNGNLPNSDIQAEIQQSKKRMYKSLYASLQKAFPFMDEKHSTLLRQMVDLASKIGYAIRGQEAEITAAAVGEGTEHFDPKTMVDEDGQTSGVIQFCVCPPFIMYGKRVDLLEKARVLCSPLPQ